MYLFLSCGQWSSLWKLCQGALIIIGQQYCSHILDLQVSLKTLNINCVWRAPHSIIRICGTACQWRNLVTLSTKWTQREVEKLVMETCLFVYAVAVVLWYATNKTDNFEDVFYILVFHHVVKCLQVKDLYAYVVCINIVLILCTHSVYDYNNKEKLLFLTLNVVIYVLFPCAVKFIVHCL